MNMEYSEKISKIQTRITKRKEQIQKHEEALKKERQLLKSDEKQLNALNNKLARAKYEDLLQTIIKNDIPVEMLFEKVEELIEKEKEPTPNLNAGNHNSHNSHNPNMGNHNRNSY